MNRCCAVLLATAALAAMGAAIPTRTPAQETGQLVIRSEPPGAHVVLDGAMRVEGTAPFVIDRGIAGGYRAQADLPGYRAWQSRVVFPGSGIDTLMISLEEQKRRDAVMRSVVIPGWGQRYLGRGTESALIFYGTVAMGIAAGYQHARYADAADAYETARDIYAQAEDPRLSEAAYALMEVRYDEMSDHRGKRNAFLWTGAAVWSVGIIDALIHGPDKVAGHPVTRPSPATASAGRVSV